MLSVLVNFLSKKVVAVVVMGVLGQSKSSSCQQARADDDCYDGPTI
jgi:hypothetical protein